MTGGGNNYIGPRHRGWRGELAVSFSSEKKRRGKPMCYGDVAALTIEDSRRSKFVPDTKLTVFKKASSRTVGGYLCSSGAGHVLNFELRDEKGTVGSSSSGGGGASDGRVSPTGSSASSSGVSDAPPGLHNLSNSTGIRDGGSNLYRVERAGSKHRNNNKTVQLDAVSLQHPDQKVVQFPTETDWSTEVDIGSVSTNHTVVFTFLVGKNKKMVKLQCPPSLDGAHLLGDNDDAEPEWSIINLYGYGGRALDLWISGSLHFSASYNVHLVQFLCICARFLLLCLCVSQFFPPLAFLFFTVILS